MRGTAIGDPRGPLEEPKEIASVKSQEADSSGPTWRWRPGNQGCNLVGGGGLQKNIRKQRGSKGVKKTSRI